MAEYEMNVENINLELWSAYSVSYSGLPGPVVPRPSPPMPSFEFSSPFPKLFPTTQFLGASGQLPVRLTGGWVDTTGAIIAPGDELTQWWGKAQDGMIGNPQPMPIAREQVEEIFWEMTYSLSWANEPNWSTYPGAPTYPIRPLQSFLSVRLFPEGSTGTDTIFGAQLGIIQLPEAPSTVTLRWPLYPTDAHWALLAGDARRIGLTAPVPGVRVTSGSWFTSASGVKHLESPGEQASLTVRAAKVVLVYHPPMTASPQSNRARFS